MRIALITGITGQDGSYLAELLLAKGYTVHGIQRRSSLPNTSRIDGMPIILHYGDITDSVSVRRIVDLVQPDEVYNLAAQSHVAVSFETPEYTANADGLGALRVLESLKGSNARFYQASTSEIFGMSPPPQNEDTPMHPCSPYGVAKLYAHWITRNYREAYGMFAVNGILFNHESPRRGHTFVTQKIVKALKRMKAGSGEVLKLGNLESIRDWGHAKDYVQAMWLMLQAPIPQDYVIATGNSCSVRDFVNRAALALGMNIEWMTPDFGTWRGKLLVKTDPSYIRPLDVPSLQGDATRAREELGWKPSYDLNELILEMLND